MTQFDLSVRFEQTDESHAKAFVNDAYVGRVKMKNGKLAFRCSDNPFTNIIPNIKDCLSVSTKLTELIQMRRVRENLIPIIIRNYLRNFAFLAENQR